MDTGSVSPDEIQKLEPFKNNFCKAHRISAGDFDTLIQSPEQDKKAFFKTTKPSLTIQEFWASVYEAIPDRDHRSISSGLVEDDDREPAAEKGGSSKNESESDGESDSESDKSSEDSGSEDDEREVYHSRASEELGVWDRHWINGFPMVADRAQLYDRGNSGGDNGCTTELFKIGGTTGA